MSMLMNSWIMLFHILCSVACEPGMCGLNCTEDCGHSTQESIPEHVDGVCKDGPEDCNLQHFKESTYIYAVCKNGCMWNMLTRDV